VFEREDGSYEEPIGRESLRSLGQRILLKCILFLY